MKIFFKKILYFIIRKSNSYYNIKTNMYVFNIPYLNVLYFEIKYLTLNDFEVTLLYVDITYFMNFLY